MTKIRSYSSILNLGHRHLEGLFDGPVIVQEKIDGSQISFGVIDGKLTVRSKGKHWDLDAGGMFDKAFEVIKALYENDRLLDGYTYRGEYLRSPKHNTIAYDRVPNGHIILYDVDQGIEDYLSVGTLMAEANRLDLEMVPTWTIQDAPEWSQVKAWAGEVSCLGGAIREGIVFKNYAKLGPDKKTLMGKYVREEFKEKHDQNWRDRHPTKGDLKQILVDTYRTEARWDKAIQHLRDNGELENEPRDIGKLIPEIKRDLLQEEEEGIKQFLFDAYWKDLSRSVIHGFPEYYKELLAKQELGESDE